MNPMAFKGTLTPDPNSFTIEVDSLIIRSNEIAFEMHGNDPETGPYDIIGKSTKQRAGYYKGNAQYRDPKTKRVLDIDEAGSYPVIYILEYTIREYGCDIEGFWFERIPRQQPIGGWLFGGSLEHKRQEQAQ